jgi:hypothetical protein
LVNITRVIKIPVENNINSTLLYHYSKVCQWLATGLWFFPGTPVFSTNKTDRYIVEGGKGLRNCRTIILSEKVRTMLTIFCEKGYWYPPWPIRMSRYIAMTSQFVITVYTLLIKFGSQDITEKVMKNTNKFNPSFTKKTP